MKAAITAILIATLVKPTFAQQATVQYSWTWSEVLAHSNTLSTATPGVIDPTEGVRLTLHATMTPDIGAGVTYTAPPGPGFGTVYAWGGNGTTIIGSANAQGAFALESVAPGFLSSGINVGSPTTALIGAVSVLFNGQPSGNFSNPVHGLISLTWTPSSYAPRTVSFTSEDGPATGYANSMIVRFGTGPSGEPLFTSTMAFTTHGPGTGAIPIVPAPGGLTALAVAATFTARRKRPAKQQARHGSRCGA